MIYPFVSTFDTSTEPIDDICISNPYRVENKVSIWKEVSTPQAGLKVHSLAEKKQRFNPRYKRKTVQLLQYTVSWLKCVSICTLEGCRESTNGVKELFTTRGIE